MHLIGLIGRVTVFGSENFFIDRVKTDSIGSVSLHDVARISVYDKAFVILFYIDSYWEGGN